MIFVVLLFCLRASLALAVVVLVLVDAQQTRERLARRAWEARVSSLTVVHLRLAQARVDLRYWRALLKSLLEAPPYGGKDVRT